MIAVNYGELTEVETRSWLNIKVHTIRLWLVWVNVWLGSIHLWPGLAGSPWLSRVLSVIGVDCFFVGDTNPNHLVRISAVPDPFPTPSCMA